MKNTKKSTQKNPANPTREQLAAAEYKRLIDLYESAAVDKVKLTIYDKLICKVAELFGILESIKDLPTVCFNPANPTQSKETAAGKVRVKYMAQYTISLTKLNKELLGDGGNDDGDDEMEEFDD